MANPKLAITRATFDATVHRTKNRLIAIPAEVQRKLGLTRRANNHILHFSIRKRGTGHWNAFWSQLNSDNEFAVPGVEPGVELEVRIHGAADARDILADGDAHPANAGALLLRLSEQADEDPRANGSTNVDEYLNRG
jgi:hypothetical protein